MSFNSPTYGRYAYNMAHSIRHYTNIPIHLISDQISLDGIDTSVFDSHDIVEFERNEFNKIDNCLAKIKLFDRSPFERTLYLDVDGVMLNNPDQLFDRFETSNIFVQPMGSGNKESNITYSWASNDIVWDKFKLKSEAIFITCQTSIIYFDRSKTAKEFFKKLDLAYKKKLKPVEYKEMWGRSKQHPDELYYSIALSQAEIVPDAIRPVFFPEKLETIANIETNYYVLSMYGGNNVKSYALKYYDRVMFMILRGKGKNHYYKADRLYRNKFINIK